MCGIAGIITTKNGVTLRSLKAMERSMVHRGPDDGSIYVSKDKKVGLVNRRLAVIDLSPAGHQPMSTPDGRFTIVHNGEVYNYQEIRKDLEIKGYKFKSNTDTEVILYSYSEWGTKCLDKFRGMYAFAIWDDLKNRLFIARDRLGIKPVYYANSGGIFVFASELKILKASGFVTSDVKPASLVAYFMMGSVPCPLTIYRDVYALEPGNYLFWQNGTFEITKYWDFPVGTREILNREEAIERTREILLDSVNLRMISDVPLGAFLSGGLDSSTIVALMRKVSDGTIRTCSMVFEEKEYNEGSYSRAVAKAFETEHYEKVVTLKDLKAEWGNIFWSMDQPTIDGVNTYFVSKTAREAGLTVALSGLGGDELFGGYRNTFYNIPKLMKILKIVKNIPIGSQLARWLTAHFLGNSKFSKLSDAFTRPPTPASAYLVMRGLFSPSEVKSLVLPEVWYEAIKEFDPMAYIYEQNDGSSFLNPYLSHLTSDSLFNWISRIELRTYTHNQLLRDTDVMSMTHSLEVRVPLLDHLLVELVLGLDESIKKDKNQHKALLIDAVSSDIPRIIKERKYKQGFTFPFSMWLEKIPRSIFLDYSNSLFYLNEKTILKILYDFYCGNTHWTKLWSLIVFTEWFKDNF